MSLLDASRELAEFPTQYVFWRAVHEQDWRILDHYIHALEDLVDALKEIDALLGSMVRTLQREQGELHQLCRVFHRDISLFEEEGKDDLAEMARHRLASYRRLQVTYEHMEKARQDERDAYRDVRLILEATLSEARQRRDDFHDYLASSKGRGRGGSPPSPLAFDPNWDRSSLDARLEDLLHASPGEQEGKEKRRGESDPETCRAAGGNRA